MGVADPQIWFLPLVAIMFIASEMAVLNTSDVNRLWLVSASLGLAYGALFNVLPMLVLEWFGMCESLIAEASGVLTAAHFGQNWGFTSMAPVIGGNIFLTLFGQYGSLARLLTPQEGCTIPTPSDALVASP